MELARRACQLLPSLARLVVRDAEDIFGPTERDINYKAAGKRAAAPDAAGFCGWRASGRCTGSTARCIALPGAAATCKR